MKQLALIIATVVMFTRSTVAESATVGTITFGPAPSGPPFIAGANWDPGPRVVFTVMLDPSTDIGITDINASSDPAQSPIPFGGNIISQNGALSFRFDGFFDITLAQILAGDPFSFVGQASNLVQNLGLPGDLIYILNGVGYCSAACATSTTTMALNAFQPESTPEGTDVLISSTPAFFDPSSGETLSQPVSITFSSVDAAGETTITASASSAAAFSFGFEALPNPIYLDVTTTCEFSGSVEMCLPYSDANDDGIVDGTSTLVIDLRLLHNEDGIFVDHTNLPVDTVNKQVCGTVTSFSEFSLGRISSPSAALTELIAGKRLLLTRNNDASKNQLMLQARDAGLTLGDGNFSSHDPVLNGGSLRIKAESGDGFDNTYQLPASGWKYASKAGKNTGYIYTGDGAIRRVVIRRSQMAGTMLARAKSALLGHTLGLDPNPVTVALRLGDQRICAEFGGTVDFETAKKFRAINAPQPSACNE